MNFSKLFLFLLIFQFFINCQKIKEMISFDSEYPNSITLNNGNILIAAENGIYLYDILDTNISQVLNFTSDHQISTSEICIQTKFMQLPDEEGGNIFCLIKDLIYVFSPEANYITFFDLSEDVDGIYYSLNFFKKESNYIYYTIAYNDKNKYFNLKYYKMNIVSNENSIVSQKNYESIDSQGNYQQLFATNIACEAMLSNTKGKVLVCFYENRNIKEVTISSFLPEYGLENIFIDKNIYIQLDTYITLITSAVSTNLKTSLFCYLITQGSHTFCFLFNIDDYSYTKPVEYSDKCLFSLETFKAFYFQKTNTFCFCCGGANIYFKFIVINEENEFVVNSEISKIDDCYSHKSLSIAYQENISKYLMIIQMNCRDGNFIRLFPLDNNTITSSLAYPEYNSFFSNINDFAYLFCPENKPLLNVENNECVDICSSDEILEKKCLINFVSENNLEIINQNIKQIIKNNAIDNNVDIIIEGNNIIYQISTTDNIKKNKYNNISSIDFGNCEIKIKEDFHIDYIIIQKTDIKINNLTSVKYELYNPNNKEEKIDLSICKEYKIKINYPVNIADEYIENYYKLLGEGYNILNDNDSFYNDVCTPYTSKSNTDVILYDRKIEFYNPNLKYCEPGCTFKKIEINEKWIQCECPIKVEDNYEIFEKDLSLSNSFYKRYKYSNYKLIVCFNLVFSKIGLINNYGSYFLIVIILFYIITAIIYYKDSKKLVANLIKKVLYSMNLGNSNFVFIFKVNPPKRKYKEHTINRNNNQIMKQRIKKSNTSYFNKSKNESIYESTILSGGNSKTKKKIKKMKSKFPLNVELNKKMFKYNDEEINLMEYEEAIKIDKRGFIKYYFSLLRKKQIIIFTFISKKDYNIWIVKYALFLISFSLYFIVNAFFFIDDTIHHIHKDNGNYNIVFQIPQIVYSFLISFFCNLIIKTLALSEKNLIDIKKDTKNLENNNEYVNLYNYLKKKIIIFFIVGFCFLLFFWYYISAFCAVYKNTQIIYLKDCSISLCLSMMYPFLINLFPGLFRIPSLRNNNKKYLYTIANILALIF